MMKRGIAILGVMALMACAARGTMAQDSEAMPVNATAKSNTTFVRCGKLIADAGQPAIDGGDVIITSGTITAVGRGLTAPACAQQQDLSKYSCIPGLIDAHIHIWTGPRGKYPSLPLATIRATKAMAYAIDSGVVAARVLGSGGFVDVAAASDSRGARDFHSRRARRFL